MCVCLSVCVCGCVCGCVCVFMMPLPLLLLLLLLLTASLLSLQECGADVNALLLGDTTPLYLAAQKGHTRMVEVCTRPPPPVCVLHYFNERARLQP